MATSGSLVQKFRNMFVSQDELNREKAAEIRKAVRSAENALDGARERMGQLGKERDAEWAKAREYAKTGQTAAAKRCLLNVQNADRALNELNNKTFVFKQMAMKLEMTSVDQKLVESLREINSTVSIDVDAIQATLDNAHETLAAQDDVDKLWSSMYAKQTQGLALSEAVESVDDMMKTLEGEVSDAAVRTDKEIAGEKKDAVVA